MHVHGPQATASYSRVCAHIEEIRLMPVVKSRDVTSRDLSRIVDHHRQQQQQQPQPALAAHNDKFPRRLRTHEVLQRTRQTCDPLRSVSMVMLVISWTSFDASEKSFHEQRTRMQARTWGTDTHTYARHFFVAVQNRCD